MSMVQHDVRNDASGNRSENIVVTRSNPVVTLGRFPQVSGTPIIDLILLAVLRGRKPIAPVIWLVRTCATFVLLGVFVATAIILVAHTLSECKSRHCQRDCDDGGKNYVSV